MTENLYTHTFTVREDQHLEATVRLNAAHPIFEGHFPQRPVLPGVCQAAILRQLLGEHLSRRLSCESVREIKFLRPILPAEDRELKILADWLSEEGKLKVKAVIVSEDEVKTKIRATFV